MWDGVVIRTGMVRKLLIILLSDYLIFIVTFFKDGAPIWINYRRNFLGQFAPKVIKYIFYLSLVLVFCHLCRHM